MGLNSLQHPARLEHFFIHLFDLQAQVSQSSTVVREAETGREQSAEKRHKTALTLKVTPS